MKEKIAAFFKKLNNSYVIAAICVILVGVILLGAMIGLVAKPFSLNTTYSAKIKKEAFGQTFIVDSKLVLLDGGRYKLTEKSDKISNLFDGTVTNFGDFGYGKGRLEEGKPIKNLIWFDGNTLEKIEVKSPFKLEFGGVVYTNGGGIFLLVCYCILICFAAAIATILLLKRNEGDIVFTNKMRLIKRLKEIEAMLGIKFEDENKKANKNVQVENNNVQETNNNEQKADDGVQTENSSEQ